MIDRDEDLTGRFRERLMEEVRRPRRGIRAEFLRGCVKYRESLDEQAPDSPRSSRYS